VPETKSHYAPHTLNQTKCAEESSSIILFYGFLPELNWLNWIGFVTSDINTVNDTDSSHSRLLRQAHGVNWKEPISPMRMLMPTSHKYPKPLQRDYLALLSSVGRSLFVVFLSFFLYFASALVCCVQCSVP